MVVSKHYDPHGKEWVIRIKAKHSEASLCGCPGEQEANTVVACVNAVLETICNGDEETEAAHALLCDLVR